jgi:hypothetical protein
MIEANKKDPHTVSLVSKDVLKESEKYKNKRPWLG